MQEPRLRVEGRTLTYNGLLFLNCYLDGELSYWHSHHIFLYLCVLCTSVCLIIVFLFFFYMACSVCYYCEFIIIRWIRIFVGFVGTGKQRIQMFHGQHIFKRLCIQRLAKPRNQISTNM